MIYDFVIIGSGPVGSTLAWLLSKKYKVCLIDKGGTKKDVKILPYANIFNKIYQPVFSDTLGGNSELWHNKIFLITKEEFNYKKWNFSYKELYKNSEILRKKLSVSKLKNVLKIGKFKISVSERSQLNNLFYFYKIDKNKNIDVIKKTSPIYFDSDSTKKNITSIVLINKKKKISRIYIKKNVIFAAGGLGNPHLILNLLDQMKKKIPKIPLKDHPHVTVGKFSKKIIQNFLNYSKFFISKNKYENNIYFHYINRKSKFFSVVQLTKNSAYHILREILQNKRKKQFFGIFKNLSFYFLNRIIFYFSNLLNKNYSFEFAFSENKNNSSITLASTKDEYGLKKININWNLEKKNLEIYTNMIKLFFRENNLKIHENILTDHLKKNFWTGQHPSCTTPISSRKNIFEVDKNLKLHNFGNIYVCGSSVFPFNGFTNPTWTAMSMAHRLANHLRDQ